MLRFDGERNKWERLYASQVFFRFEEFKPSQKIYLKCAFN